MSVRDEAYVAKVAPIVGRAMAELITACENGLDHDASPLGVPAATSDAILDMGAYSRRRPVPSEARISVL